MKPWRALALAAVLPAAVSLAACGGGGGGSTGFNNAVGNSAQVRYVNGVPGSGGYDVYFTSTGTSTSSTPLITSLAYEQITDFASTNPVAATIILRAANSNSGSPTLGGCTIPQLTNNGVYSVVFYNSGAGAQPTCGVFQDLNYSAPGQYRVHHASPLAAAGGNGTISFGLTNGATAATFTAVGTATFPSATAGQISIAPVSVNPAVTASAPVGFAIGASAQPGATVAPVLAQIASSQLVTPGGTFGNGAGPNTTNTLPGGGYNNASIFAIDGPNGGTTLIGSFDSK